MLVLPFGHQGFDGLLQRVGAHLGFGVGRSNARRRPRQTGVGLLLQDLQFRVGVEHLGGKPLIECARSANVLHPCLGLAGRGVGNANPEPDFPDEGAGFLQDVSGLHQLAAVTMAMEEAQHFLLMRRPEAEIRFDRRCFALPRE